MKKQISLFLIFILAFFPRFYGINWDSGFHLHPDERMLIMVAERINFFDQLNPQFFNYGSLPIYLLKGLSQLSDFIFKTNLANYNGMLYLGRILSVIFDLLTVIFVYKTVLILFPNIKYSISTIAFFSSFFYAIAFFPIQNTHFFISDVFLTCFLTFLIYLLLSYFKNDRIKIKSNKLKETVVIACVFAMAFSSKLTAIIFYPIVLTVIFFVAKNRLSRLINLLIFNFGLLIFNFIFMPFAFLDYKKFLNDVILQVKMNNNPYIFPYTLQYVNTFPYLYYLKNMFFWGLGPIISFLCLIGFVSFLFQLSKIINQNDKEKSKLLPCLLYLAFYLFYFLVIGRSSVKFMRYMLPLYPFLATMAGLGAYQISNIKYQKYILKIKNNSFSISQFLNFLIFFSTLLWTLTFINIYSQPHTRISATEWILKNIPAGSNLAVEHWDDRLPLLGGEKYNFLEMTLYDQPDDERKWFILYEKLKLADYIIIASHRLYLPLQKLADCRKYKICYPKTAEYYRKLFNGKLGFSKIAEFAVYPKFSIFNFQFLINDKEADESFTVYDHPKVMVFKKN
ncbi:MAG: glycosyltransferase family 39 protein [Microgenomates group bacterium]